VAGELGRLSDAHGRIRRELGLALSKDETLSWESRLRDRGWLVPHWDVAWGGTGWSAHRVATATCYCRR
jgi:hypothetical protein